MYYLYNLIWVFLSARDSCCICLLDISVKCMCFGVQDISVQYICSVVFVCKILLFNIYIYVLLFCVKIFLFNIYVLLFCMQGIDIPVQYTCHVVLCERYFCSVNMFCSGCKISQIILLRVQNFCDWCNNSLHNQLVHTVKVLRFLIRLHLL